MSRKTAWPKPFTQRNLLDRSRIGVVTVRGVQWVTDGYVLARADLFANVPKPAGRMTDWPGETSVAKVLRRTYLSEGSRLRDSRAVITSTANTVRMMELENSVSTYTAVNAKVLDEWLGRRTWHKVRLADPAVAFYELRKNRPVLAGLIMPVRLHGGTWSHVPLLDVAA